MPSMLDCFARSGSQSHPLLKNPRSAMYTKTGNVFYYIYKCFFNFFITFFTFFNVYFYLNFFTCMVFAARPKYNAAAFNYVY